MNLIGMVKCIFNKLMELVEIQVHLGFLKANIKMVKLVVMVGLF